MSKTERETDSARGKGGELVVIKRQHLADWRVELEKGHCLRLFLQVLKKLLKEDKSCLLP